MVGGGRSRSVALASLALGKESGHTHGRGATAALELGALPWVHSMSGQRIHPSHRPFVQAPHSEPTRSLGVARFLSCGTPPPPLGATCRNGRGRPGARCGTGDPPADWESGSASIQIPCVICNPFGAPFRFVRPFFS